MVSAASTVMGEMEQAEHDLDALVGRIDAGEDTIAMSEPVEEPVCIKQPLDKVVAVRLTDAQWRQLYAEARELRVGPTTLMRKWTLERLRASTPIGLTSRPARHHHQCHGWPRGDSNARHAV